MLNEGISEVKLSSFRNYSDLHLTLHSPLIVLTGDNGVGKTNILEALSLFSPGRGLRSATLSQFSLIPGLSPPVRWSAAICLKEGSFDTMMGTGLEHTPSGGEKRAIKINGVPVRTQSEFLEYLNIIWLIPSMARLFQEGGSGRRKFIDRMVYGVDPSHSHRLHRYDHYLRERSLLLKQGQFQPSWLDSLEKNLAEDGVAIVASRSNLVRQLTQHQPCDPLSPFPRFFAKMQGDVEQWCDEMPAVEVEEKLRIALFRSRNQDAQTGGASYGPQKSDLFVNHLSKQMQADFCSTGEQKMLLIALVLAFTKQQVYTMDRLTLLLLDDLIAHLDKNHRSYLFQELCQMGSNGARLQTWMTGTTVEDFTDLGQQAQYITIKNSNTLRWLS